MATVGSDQFRQDFIKSIKARLEEFCNLATQCHPHHLPCEPLPLPGQGGPIQYGHFNLCVFIQFRHLNPEKWVIRIPFPDQRSWSAEKMTSEIMTMTYVAAKTDIPLPRVHNYSLSSDNLIDSPYMIMDYMEGRRLHDLIRQHKIPHSNSQIKKAHLQVANVYLQLRQLEFPAIGALGPTQGLNKPLNNCSPAEIGVSGRPFTLDMALQAREGYHPDLVIKPKTTFQSSRAFVDALAKLSANRFQGLTGSIPNQGQNPPQPYDQYVLKTFHKLAARELCKSDGPYVLMHGDLMLHDGNILFDDNFNLIAVIDWEWSFVAPLQFLVPPVWLSGSGIIYALMGQDLFDTKVQNFRSQVRMLESKKRQLSLLYSPWSSTAEVWGIALLAALLHPDNIQFAFSETLFWHIYGFKRNMENLAKLDEVIRSLPECVGTAISIEEYLTQEFE